MENILSKKYLDDEFLKLNQVYTNNDPFNHIVIDNFVSNEKLEKALSKINEIIKFDKLNYFDHNQKKKKISTSEESLPNEFVELIRYFNSQVFLNFLQRVTGIKEKLISDPYLWGGGLHTISRGGFLKIHSDTNFHPDFKLDRRLNLLIYLNKDWKDSYGGNLELWDKDMKKCVKSIKPIFNRAVIFSTDDRSYHGHPDPLNCPEDLERRSIAFYYYSNGRSDVKTDFGKGTYFRQRLSNPKDYSIVVKNIFDAITPPIINKIISKFILRRFVKRLK